MGFFLSGTHTTQINFDSLVFFLQYKDRLEKVCMEGEREKILSMSFLFFWFCAENYPAIMLGIVREQHVYAARIRVIP